MSYSLRQRRIYLWGDIKESTAKRFVQSIHYLLDINTKPIYIFISSNGGEVDAAMSIIDEIIIAKLYAEIYTICHGKAFSAGADILTMGTEGCRMATANSTIMFHLPSYGLHPDYITQQESFIEYQNKQNASVTKMVAAACKKNYTKFSKDIANTLWLDAEGAKKYRAIDRIVEDRFAIN